MPMYRSSSSRYSRNAGRSYSRVYRRYTGVPKLAYGDRRTLTMTKYGLDRKPLVFRYAGMV